MASTTMSGHVLDQFVQASRIEIAGDAVAIEVDLTPGIELAPAVFFAINTDRDGVISTGEARAHAARVLADLVLEIDGRRLPLALASADYPPFDAMRGGVGTIRLRAVAPLPIAAGTHRLHYRNTHRQDASVYLVNALVPSAPGITLGAPRRDARQQTFDIAYAQSTGASHAASATHGAWSAALVAVMVIVPAYLGLRRWRRRTAVARL
jgi:hypothetical protein